MAQKKLYEEQASHRTAELPIALHQLSYPADTDMLFYLHWHKEFEFLVVTEGEMEFTIEERIYALSTGDCVFINSDFYHSAKNTGSGKCSFFALDFSYEFLEENLLSHFAREYICPVLEGKIVFQEVIHSASVPGIFWQTQAVSFLNEINFCGEEQLSQHELMIKARLYFIWELFYKHGIYKNYENSSDLRRRERLKPVLDYIKENYSYEITLSELSGLLPMSDGQFCRIFKETMKVTPFQYLLRYRILKSCSLLMETDKKIGEIANLSGFGNISYFNKMFLGMIGCTPGEYRKAYHQNPSSSLSLN